MDATLTVASGYTSTTATTTYTLPSSTTHIDWVFKGSNLLLSVSESF